MYIRTHCYLFQIVAGWGAKEQGGPVSANLQKVTVPVLSNKHCNSRTLYLGKIQDSQVCAGKLSGGKDSCQGIQSHFAPMYIALLISF